MAQQENPEQAQNVVPVLDERGLVSQMTENGLPEAAAAGQLTVYCGFDATAPSLQLGNLVPVMALAHFQRHGHRPILVVGGGTSMIGDPGGKSVERPLLTSEQVAEYAARIKTQLARYLAFEGPSAARIVNNADWLDKISMIGFLRDIGKHFSVNSMLAKETVASRLESGISYTEFSYMLVQATDFLHLFQTYNCVVQIGGNDQWGNLTAGVELIRRVSGARVNALTVPLITSASGAKFGKSEGNALWLDPNLTTPYQLYQYFINVDDRDVAHYLRVFTFLPLTEIARIEREAAAHPEQRIGQRVLAFEIVKLVHGDETAITEAEASEKMFGRGEVVRAIEKEVQSWPEAEPLRELQDELQKLPVPHGDLVAQIARRVQETKWPDVEAMNRLNQQMLKSAVPSAEYIERLTQDSLRLAALNQEAMRKMTERILSSALPNIEAMNRMAQRLSSTTFPDMEKLQQSLTRTTVLDAETLKRLTEHIQRVSQWVSTLPDIETMARIQRDILTHLASAVPTSRLPEGAISNGAGTAQPLLDTLVAVGAQPSKGAARRLMQQGGVYVNEQRWSEPERALTSEDLFFDRAVLVRLGKNKYHLLLSE